MTFGMSKVIAQQQTNGIGPGWPVVNGAAIHLCRRSRSFESVGRCQKKSHKISSTPLLESGANPNGICAELSEQSSNGWTSETSLTEFSSGSNSRKVDGPSASDFAEISQICDRLCGRKEDADSNSRRETSLCASNDEESDIVATLQSDRSSRSHSKVITFNCAPPQTDGRKFSNCKADQWEEIDPFPLGKKQKKSRHSTAKGSWLLRLFESKLFDMSIAIQYLFNSKEPGVQSYIGNFSDN